MNRLRFLRELLYDLKREYGMPAAIHKVTVGTVDVATGAVSNTVSRVNLSRMILMPAKYKDAGGHFAAVLSSSNNNFNYGGLFQVGDRAVIIDQSDLPRDYIVERSTYIVFESNRYNLVDFTRLDSNAGWFLHLRQTQKEPPLAVNSLIQGDRVTFVESTTGALL